MINRDIFLMVHALNNPEQYAGVQINGGGMSCQELFESIKRQRFHGFIYVAKGTELCISDCDVQNLVLRSYTTALYHDVVCVMDECGNVSSALRTMDFYKIHAVHQHQLYKKTRQMRNCMSRRGSMLRCYGVCSLSCSGGISIRHSA